MENTQNYEEILQIFKNFGSFAKLVSLSNDTLHLIVAKERRKVARFTFKIKSIGNIYLTLI